MVEEFADGWFLLEGSSLCPYDDRYFCLKFQKRGSTEIQMRWLLPEDMSKDIKRVMDETNTPEEQACEP